MAAVRIELTFQFLRKATEVPILRILCALGVRSSFSCEAPASQINFRRKNDIAFFVMERLGLFGDTKRVLGLSTIEAVLVK